MESTVGFGRVSGATSLLKKCVRKRERVRLIVRCCLPSLIQLSTISAVKQKLYNQEGEEGEGKKNHNSALIPLARWLNIDPIEAEKKLSDVWPHSIVKIN